MSVDVLGYLNSKSLTMKRASGSEVNVPCFFHGEDPQKRGRLYVNVDPDAEIPGLFFCQVCGEKGSLVSLKRHFGDATSETEDTSQVRLEILQAAAGFYHSQLGDYDDAFMFLRGPERMLETDTIVDHELGYAGDRNELLHFLKDAGFPTQDILNTGLVLKTDAGKFVDSLKNRITIPYRVAGNVVSIRGRAWPFEEGTKTPKYKTCGGNITRLFNSDVTWNADEVVVCEGEFDALIMGQLGFNAVGVPGARIWQDSWDGYVSNVRRLWLVFDRDKAGEDGAQKLVDRFGVKVKRVHLSPEGTKKDPTTWVAEGGTAEQFADLMKEALAGGLLVTVDEAMEEHASVQGLLGVKFGMENLDLMIEPGLLPAQVMVVLAKAGTGKTLFLLNTMHRMTMVPGQQKLRFLFVSLEQTRGEWFERARRIHRFYNLDSTDADALNFWRERLLLVDKNRLTEADFHSILDDYEYRVGQLPDVVFLDYLGYWAQAFKGDRYERVSDAIMSLKSVAKDRRISIISPHQVSRVARYGEEPDADAARDAGVVEETADFLFTLWSPDAQLGRAEEEKGGLVNMRIGKSRHGGRGTKVVFQFAPISLALVPVGEPKTAQRARDELEFERLWHDKWEQAVYRHRTGFRGHLDRNPAYQGPIPDPAYPDADGLEDQEF